MNILIVEDDDLQRKVLFDSLRKEKHTVRACDCLMEARTLLSDNCFDLAFFDMRLPDGNGIELLEKVTRDGLAMRVVIVTAFADVPSAVQAIRAGAYDYLPKPYSAEQLFKIVRNVNETLSLHQQIEGLARVSSGDVPGGDVWKLDGMIGSAALRHTFEKSQKIAAFPDTTVLLQGESGTGKGVMAQTIHRLSSRANQPFVDVNCSAIPGSLMESEIFGYEKGAFTDAKNSKPGLLEAADGGTLFLDEIGDMEPALQGKLLKVIEDKKFRRLGGRRIVEVNVRIMSATCRNLEEMVKDGRFREDLFYRLSVFPIVMPPLREHPESIVPLAEHSLASLSRSMGRAIDCFTPCAVEAMQTYEWPGNVRELRHAVERAVILCSENRIEAKDLGLPSPEKNGNGSGEATRCASDPEGDVPPMSMKECERWLIERALRQVDGHRGRAAELLRIHRSTLHKKISEFGLG